MTVVMSMPQHVENDDNTLGVNLPNEREHTEFNDNNSINTDTRRLLRETLTQDPDMINFSNILENNRRNPIPWTARELELLESARVRDETLQHELDAESTSPGNPPNNHGIIFTGMRPISPDNPPNNHSIIFMGMRPI